MRRSGFTLVELLVVITIIGVLSMIGITVFSTAQKNAQDAKRKGDVDSVVKVLEQKYPLDGDYTGVTDTDFTAKKVPLPPEGGAYISKGCEMGTGKNKKITAFQVCAKLGGYTEACPTTGTNESKCYCRTSALGDIDNCVPDGGVITTNIPGLEGAGGGTAEGGGGVAPPSPPPPPSKALSCENYGDMDNNRLITKNDVDILTKHDAGTQSPPLTADQLYIGNIDVDDPGKGSTVDISDSAHLNRYLAGGITSLEICKLAKSIPCSRGTGDVTGDGKVTWMDAQEAARIGNRYPSSLYTGQPYTQAQRNNADSTGNGAINSSDSLCILRYVNGMATSSVCSYLTDCTKPAGPPPP